MELLYSPMPPAYCHPVAASLVLFPCKFGNPFGFRSLCHHDPSDDSMFLTPVVAILLPLYLALSIWSFFFFWLLKSLFCDNTVPLFLELDLAMFSSGKTQTCPFCVHVLSSEKGIGICMTISSLKALFCQSCAHLLLVLPSPQ